MTESWCDKVKREHPWWYRYAVLRDRVERVLDWVLDKPYWTADLTETRGLRTGKRKP